MGLTVWVLRRVTGLADGYFVLPNTINDYLADESFEKIDDSHPQVIDAMNKTQKK